MMSQLGSLSRCARSAPVALRSALAEAVRSAILTYFGRFAIARSAQGRRPANDAGCCADRGGALSWADENIPGVGPGRKSVQNGQGSAPLDPARPPGWRTPMSEKPYDRLDGVIWYDGKLIDWADATLHVCSHGLHYASSVFEGERAYGGQIFKCTEHSERLKKSAQTLDFEIPYSVAEIDAAKRLVLEKNGQQDAYVRPIAWRGSEMMGVSAQNNKIHLAIATWQWPSYFDPAQRLAGIRLDLADYRRPDPTTAPARAKAAGLYMICTISKHKAERKGYADAMMLDWQGRVAECTGANIFFIKDGKIHTPTADCFLAGITRATAIMMAKKRGIEVIERRIMPDELSNFSECFITGTAAEVTAVSEIAQWQFTPGAITQHLMSDYTAEVQPKGKAAAA